MPAPTMSSVVRTALTGNINLSADEVITLARAKGVTAPDRSIRDSVYNIRSELRRKAAKSVGGATPPKPVPAAARATSAQPAPKAVAEPPVVPPSDLSGVLSNVALVNTVVGASGGVEQARQVAEAVRACGSVDAFLQHLDLVAKVRGASA